MISGEFNTSHDVGEDGVQSVITIKNMTEKEKKHVLKLLTEWQETIKGTKK